MSFFNPDEPILRLKQTDLDIQDLQGLIHIQWRRQQQVLWRWLYTRIDQVFLLWGWITAIIFWVPQTLPALSWSTQAWLWSVLTLLGMGVMGWLAWFWVRVENLRWLVIGWSGLLLVGVGVTDYGIFCGQAWILSHLCLIWLGFCGCGYLAMGLGMRSRTFLIVALMHLAAVGVLPQVASWQFGFTGTVMAGSLFLLAEVQWDMRPPIASKALTPEQNAFNFAQYQRRKSNAKCQSI